MRQSPNPVPEFPSGPLFSVIIAGLRPHGVRPGVPGGSLSPGAGWRGLPRTAPGRAGPGSELDGVGEDAAEFDGDAVGSGVQFGGRVERELEPRQRRPL